MMIGVPPILPSTSYWTKYSPYFVQILCNGLLDHMIQDRNVGAKFHRHNTRLAKYRENVGFGGHIYWLRHVLHVMSFTLLVYHHIFAVTNNKFVNLLSY